VNWIHLAQDRVQWRAGYCEHGNEASGFIIEGEFLSHLRDCWLLKKNCAPWNLSKVHFRSLILMTFTLNLTQRLKVVNIIPRRFI
jgi:hypothetical protein